MISILHFIRLLEYELEETYNYADSEKYFRYIIISIVLSFNLRYTKYVITNHAISSCAISN